MVRVLLLSGAVTVVIAVVLGALVSPWLYLIALFALVDLALASAYSSGRLTIKNPSGTAGPTD